MAQFRLRRAVKIPPNPPKLLRGRGDFKDSRICGVFSLLVLVLLIVFLASCKIPTTPDGSVPTPPRQPASGPGGADYKHNAVAISSYGRGEDKYWIFEPASEKPESAPLIVFNHGWGATNPAAYGAWIDHLVRRGNIVVYPVYQKLTTPFEEATGNAIAAVLDAIQRLRIRGKVRPELDKFAITGHSFGATMTLNMAALAASAGLPEPKAIMPVEFGEFSGEYLVKELTQIPPTVLMLIVVGEEDKGAGTDFAGKVFNRITQIPLENKDFVTVMSDYHGSPPLVADHFAPVAPDERYNPENLTDIGLLIWRGVGRAVDAKVNAMDFYGFWKLFDGLTDAAFYGKNREYALGNTEEQRFMGRWSDGTPIAELVVTKSP